jgi:hypothetical protein
MSTDYHQARRAPRCYARAQAVPADQFRRDAESDAVLPTLCLVGFVAAFLIVYFGGSV